MYKHFTSIFPAEFKGNPKRWRGIALGLVILFMLITQLFSFEDYPTALFVMGLPGGIVMATVLAYVTTALEALSLPFLMSMSMGKGLYEISRWSLVLVAVVWLSIALISQFATSEDGVVAIFGATVPVFAGLWFVLFTLLLLLASVYMFNDLKRRSR